MLKVLLLVSLALVVAHAAEGEASAESKGKVVIELVSKPRSDSEPKTVKPHMHPRGALRHTHVHAFPVGYEPQNFRRDVQYFGGGAPVTTEQLHRNFPHADRRITVDVKGASRGTYDWDTPEYQFEYEQRTGEVAASGLSSSRDLPVIHYPRGSLPRAGRKAAPKAKAQAKAQAQAPAPKADVTSEISRLEKGLAFALRTLSAHQTAITKAQKRSQKQKNAIKLLAKHAQKNRKAVRVLATHAQKNRAAVRVLAKNAQKNRAAVRLIAKHLAGDEKRIVANSKHVDALSAIDKHTVINQQKIKSALRLVAATLQADQARVARLVNLVNQLTEASHVSAKNWEALRHLNLGAGMDPNSPVVKRLEKGVAFALKTLGDHQARLQRAETLVHKVAARR